MTVHRNRIDMIWRALSLSLLITTVVVPQMSGQRTAPIEVMGNSIEGNNFVLVASEIAPAAPTAQTSSVSAIFAGDDLVTVAATSAKVSQPPPRRYGRPNYSDKNSNPDGSLKYTFFGGVGGVLPIGNTHVYETPAYGFQIGGARNFNQNLGLALQFDYDHFGLQANTLANQRYVYNYCTPATIAAGQCPPPIASLDGNNHVWSFTLNPTFPLATQGALGAYAVFGGGFYHKVTNFTVPTTAQQCNIYGCGSFNVDQTVAHYTSNAGGVNGGFGLTCKLSKFSSRQLYLEARYVLILNQQRAGYTAQNVATTTYTGFNAYPANSHRTTYIPIKFGIRF